MRQQPQDHRGQRGQQQPPETTPTGEAIGLTQLGQPHETPAVFHQHRKHGARLDDHIKALVK